MNFGGSLNPIMPWSPSYCLTRLTFSSFDDLCRYRSSGSHCSRLLSTRILPIVRSPVAAWLMFVVPMLVPGRKPNIDSYSAAAAPVTPSEVVGALVQEASSDIRRTPCIQCACGKPAAGEGISTNAGHFDCIVAKRGHDALSPRLF